MKKIMLSLGLMLGALTLTNCSNEIDENINTNTDGVAFELTAAIDANRTVANGFKTTWAANDAINLFHAVAGETTYNENESFAIAEEDLANGRFVGTLGGELTAEAYDWYAFYPYSKYVHSPKGEDPAHDYYQIWSQTQSVVANSTAHVVGKNGPLYGVVKNVVAGEPVKVQMHQLGTLLRVKVGNESGEDFIIKSINITAAKSSLTSSFLVDLTGESGAVIPCEGYAKQDVTLNVTGEYTIADGDDASDHCFYAAVAPFTAPEGGEILTITVVTDKGTYKTTKDIPAGAEFASGVVNSLVVTVEATEEIKAITVAEFLALNDGDGPYILSGTIKNVASTTYGNFDLVDATGSVYVYGLCSPEGVTQYWTPSGVKAGDCLTVYATRGDYNGTKQAKNALYISHYGITVAAPADEVAAAGGSAEVAVTLPETAVEGATVSVACEGEGATATYADGKVVVTFEKNTGAPRAAEVTVKYGLAENSFSVVQAKGEDFAGEVTKEATITFDNKSKRTEFSTTKQVWKENGIVVTNNKASSNSNVADYAAPARFYQSTEFILEAPGNIKKLVFSCSGGKNLKLSNGSNYTVSNSGTATVTVEFTAATSNTFTISSLANQIRLNSIVVTYVDGGDEGGSTGPVDQTLAFNNTSATATVGQDFTEPTLSGAQTTVAYTSSNTAVATVDATTGEVTLVAAGTTTITATAAANDEYNEATASYELTVNAAPAGTVDVLNYDFIGISGTSYTEWTKTSASGTEFAGQSAAGNNAIQLRSTNSNSGIVITKSNGKTVKKISVVKNSKTAGGRELAIYAQNTPFTSPTEMYGSAVTATKLGVIALDSQTEFVIEGDYEYIGVRSAFGAQYLDSITITYND